MDLESVYPSESNLEFSFEELRAMSRGWTQKDWRPQKVTSPLNATTGNASMKSKSRVQKSKEPEDVENLTQAFQQKAHISGEANASFGVGDVSTQSIVGMPESEMPPPPLPGRLKQKKLKIREVKQETQTVKTRLESPTGRKLKRKNSTAEPTMTFHSKAATNDIYDMFNQPLRKPSVAGNDSQSGDDAELTEDDGYSTTGESTGTGRVSAPSSEFGDDTLASIRRGRSQSQSQSESVSPWSDFSTSKHVPRFSSTDVAGDEDKAPSGKNHRRSRHKDLSEDLTDNFDSSSQNPTQTSGLGTGLDTQAIAAIAGGNFDEMDTKAIAMMAGDVDVEDAVDVDDAVGEDHDGVSVADEGAPASTLEQTVSNGSATPNEDPLATPIDDEFPQHLEIQHKPRFIPIPPVDYEPTPARPYRDPELAAQNKLPFMTPIAERTESSLAPSTVFDTHGDFDVNTPSRGEFQTDSPSKGGIGNKFLVSPELPTTTSKFDSPAKRKHIETGIFEDEDTGSPQKKVDGKEKFNVASTPTSADTINNAIARTSALALNSQSPVRSPLANTRIGPVIPDLQCNPCDDAVRQQILTSVHPPVSNQKGYHESANVTSGRYAALKSFGEKNAKAKAKASPRKSHTEKTITKAVPPVLKFHGTSRVYAVKRELGQGAFAPVYLVDSYDPEEAQELKACDKENKSPPTFATARGSLEALKTECPPGTLVWEFHILRTVKQRLGSAARTMQSIVLAHECHLYRDEAFIVLSYSPHGTLLDLVNAAKNENIKAGKPAEGLDEMSTMWLSVELLRTLEDLHGVGILHGDLKGDNCLVRFDMNTTDITAQFDADGNYGWNSRGLTLIDFGRGIDTRVFKPKAQFIADWPSYPTDCAEIRECRPWKWQIDYHGAAGIIHTLLFGKYIDTIPVANGGGSSALGPGQKKEWRLKESFKRYWEKDIWTDLFATLLNPGSVVDGEEMPIQNNLRRLRSRMEKYLVEEGEKGGRDLRASLRRMERLVGAN